MMHRAHFNSRLFGATLIAALLTGCNGDDEENLTGTAAMLSDDPAAESALPIPDDSITPVDGLISVSSIRSVAEAVGELETSLLGNPAILTLPTVDHQANAASIGETLRPTQVALFGNPELGTQLMQRNQLAGLDLPQKILVWEDAAGEVRLGYNSASYLRNRHALVGVEEALNTIDNALAILAGNAAGATSAGAGSDIDTSADSGVAADEGIITVTSAQDMDTTYNALIAAIESAAPLNLFAEIDHAANAATVGQELRPTRVAVFGNPALGTPLMQSRQTIGIDLPQKMLVFENEDGTVTIAYNDPAFMAARHGVSGQDARINQISTALAGLAQTAAGTGTGE